MLTIDWNIVEGWHKPEIIPYGPITLHNTATSLHYGISVHEGLSSTMNANTGKLQIFRPDMHLNSFLQSSIHIDMPGFDQNELLGCLKKLASIDKSWYPKGVDFPTQMYIRLCHISTDE